MFAGSDWKCVIVNFLLFCFKNRVKGQIPELHYIKKKKKAKRDWAFHRSQLKQWAALR